MNSSRLTSLMLWRIDENKFRVMQYDDVAPLLTNVDYVLMDRKYKSIINGHPTQVEIKDVMITDQVRNLKWDNFFELIIHNDISPETIYDVDSSGLKIWTYGNMGVFVSDGLKNEFERISSGELEFSEGFSLYA